MEQKLVNMPKTKRGLVTLEKITQSAEIEFGTKGYYSTSINDITKKANVALGTFYIYFPDKFSLYCYLLNQYSHDIRKFIAMKTESCEGRIDTEKLGLLGFLEVIKLKPYMYNIIWESLYVDKSLFIEYYESFALKYIIRLNSGKRKNEIRDIDSTVIAYVLMGISNFIGLKYVMFEKDEDLEAIVDQVMDVLKHGIFL